MKAAPRPPPRTGTSVHLTAPCCGERRLGEERFVSFLGFFLHPSRRPQRPGATPRGTVPTSETVALNALSTRNLLGERAPHSQRAPVPLSLQDACTFPIPIPLVPTEVPARNQRIGGTSRPRALTGVPSGTWSPRHSYLQQQVPSALPQKQPPDRPLPPARPPPWSLPHPLSLGHGDGLPVVPTGPRPSPQTVQGLCTCGPVVHRGSHPSPVDPIRRDSQKEAQCPRAQAEASNLDIITQRGYTGTGRRACANNVHLWQSQPSRTQPWGCCV